MKRFVFAILAGAMLPSGAALAREDNPTQIAAPGEGPVIHLFGAQSVFNKVGNAVPEQAQNQVAPAANTTATQAAAPAANAATPADNSADSTGSLLHRMFVTGDNTPTSARLSQGRPGAR